MSWDCAGYECDEALNCAFSCLTPMWHHKIAVWWTRTRITHTLNGSACTSLRRLRTATTPPGARHAITHVMTAVCAKIQRRKRIVHAWIPMGNAPCVHASVWRVHHNRDYVVVWSDVVEHKTIYGKKAAFDDACAKVTTSEVALKSVQAGYDKAQAEIHDGLHRVAGCYTRLRVLGLTTYNHTTGDYLRLCTENETLQAGPGCTDRVRELNKLVRMH
jgi:hypothetical protein